MSELQTRILSHVKSEQYRPQRPRRLARELNVADEQSYHAFRDALRELMHEGRVVLGAGGTIVLPGQSSSRNEFVGTYRQNKRGFGFVIPTDPASHEDLYIPQGENGGAITGDVVKAKITSRGQRDGKAIYTGRIVEVIQRSQKRFVGTLTRKGSDWSVLPDGNTLTEAILTPDAAARNIRPGTKVVVELTSYPNEDGRLAQGVITEVLGQAGEKDVDLRSIIIQKGLPEIFPDEVLAQARQAIDAFDPAEEKRRRLDLSDQIICTIDPVDAKDYDDAISLRRLDDGNWQLGVHIADVSYFVPQGSALDEEAYNRGNSTYFPGFVIPMLPEILSNGVCSLQEGVPRLCKSAFITYDQDAKPISTKFANTVIHSRKRLRYEEAQAIIDGADSIPHPDGAKKLDDYPTEVIELLRDMNHLARRLHKRRGAQGQIVLDLPRVNLVLDQDGKVVDAVPEDQSFTHTLIEMFMVEANEAVARLFDGKQLPFIRRTHPEPDMTDTERLRAFVQVSGFKLPKTLDRKAIQSLLATVRGKPESYAINLAILKSLTRAEYSPEPIGHFALASEHYCHFTSPIRRYADLTIHRLLDAYFAARDAEGGRKGARRAKLELDDIPSFEDLVEIGRHISFTERRSADAESELRQVKLLELLSHQIGEEYNGVVTGITNFGIFIQLERYLIEGLIRYESLMDDWWDVDARNGFVRGQRTGTRINIGDVCKIYIVRVDTARRELDLAISELVGRGKKPVAATETSSPKSKRPPKRNKQDLRRPPQQHRGHSKPKGRGKRGRR
ncbi:MAG TPA: ribonuclease R [Humisphaera sp.]|jgi:ribonuclease R|nr:ribonuclease R [Humisphaera sp.]